MSDQPKPLPANAVHSIPSYTPDQLRAWLELSRTPGVHTTSPDYISTTEEASKDPRVQDLIRIAAGVTGRWGMKQAISTRKQYPISLENTTS